MRRTVARAARAAAATAATARALRAAAPRGATTAAAAAAAAAAPARDAPAAPRLGFGAGLRGFAASGTDGGEAFELSADEQSEVLRGASVRALREALSVHGATRATMPREELVALARDAGAAESDEHAERVVDALHDAGVVLRVRDDVLLRPEVLTAAVGAALGARGTAEGGGVVLTDSLRKRLSELRERVNDELKPLAAEHDEIERSAVRRARAILWTGYAGLLTQFGVFYQLTFYELSWDVMEPVSYFTGLALMIGGYTYFMTTERECTNQNVFQKIVCQRMDTLYAKQGFDVRKYGALKEQVAQLDRMLQGS